MHDLELIAMSYNGRLNPLPCIERFREHIDYNRDTGVFAWKYNPNKPRYWNTRYSGKVAGSVDAKGYRVISIKIDGIEHNIKAHRLAVALITGEWPSGQVDHINRDKLDNSFDNLIQCESVINNKNRSTPVTNTSGYICVGYHKATSKFYASISFENGRVHLGLFNSEGEAYIAVKAAQKVLAYSPLHGTSKVDYMAKENKAIGIMMADMECAGHLDFKKDMASDMYRLGYRKQDASE